MRTSCRRCRRRERDPYPLSRGNPRRWDGRVGSGRSFRSRTLKIFQVGMTVGTGFIALALTMVGGWNPWRILVASVLFGLLRSLAMVSRFLAWTCARNL